jgi:diaminohydroxyphosphoribosylaminopyrimidine deaminase/5-amino-6-(5-phosphoribosylamino)uracil reductase
LSWTAADHAYMSRALQLARRGLFTTLPNPRVGCVLVRDGEIAGEGWHERAGGPHAEIAALAAAGGKASGATCYVTLEPCAHAGRTGPCADALLAAGVARVVAATIDPNPLVGGQGVARLAAAGIAVDSGLLEAEAEALNAGFMLRMREGRPFLRCKLAVSRDGRTAPAGGGPGWISGQAARRDVQRLRARSGAVITGIGTVLADDPRLNLREAGLRDGQPLRVVMDRRLRFPEQARMLGLPGRTLIMTECADAARQERLRKAGGEVVVPRSEGAGFALAVLRHLAREEQVNEALLEGGATLSGALLAEGLVDELVLYQAPVVLGGAGSPPFRMAGNGFALPPPGFRRIEARRIGRDWRLVFQPARRTGRA